MYLCALTRAAMGFLFAILSGASLWGDVLTSSFPVSPIPDGDPGGITLNLGTAPAVRSLQQITLTLSHEWLGDLTVRVLPPAGPAITLFDRLEVTPANPDGSSAVVGKFVFNSDNVGVLVPQSYQFAEFGSDLTQAADRAVATSPASLLPSQTLYASANWAEGPFPEGTWKVLLADSAELSSGTISSAEIVYTSVPEPGTFTLLLLAVYPALLSVLRSLRERARTSWNCTRLARPCFVPGLLILPLFLTSCATSAPSHVGTQVQVEMSGSPSASFSLRYKFPGWEGNMTAGADRDPKAQLNIPAHGDGDIEVTKSTSSHELILDISQDGARIFRFALPAGIRSGRAVRQGSAWHAELD